MKKYSKILLTLFFAFFASINVVSAKEMTIEEFGKLFNETNPDASYVYVIGEYAFSSKHILTTQDAMIAARTIKLAENSGATAKDPIYGAMTAFYLEVNFDDDFNFLGLEVKDNKFGTTKAPEKYDIKYIDYVEVKEEDKSLATQALIDKAYTTVENQIKGNSKLEVSRNGNEFKVTLLDLEMTSVESLAGTGIATAALNLLETEGVASATIKVNGAQLTLTKEDLADFTEAAEKIDEFIEAAGIAKAGDLIGKPVSVVIAAEAGYQVEGATEFVVSFDKKELATQALIDKAYTTVENQIKGNSKLEVSRNGNEFKVTLLDLEMTSVESLAGTGIATAALNLLETEGVASATIKVNGAQLTLTKEDLADFTKAAEKIDEFIEAAGIDTAADLVGKAVSVVITGEAGYQVEGATEFAVSFDALANVNF